MQSHYPAEFEREMGCTEAELLGWLPGACAGRPIEHLPGHAVVAIEQGRLSLQWLPLAPRRIARLVMPRLAVRFAFDRVDERERQRFMRYFDLYTQRGGG